MSFSFFKKVTITSPSGDIYLQNTHCHAPYGLLLQYKGISYSLLVQLIKGTNKITLFYFTSYKVSKHSYEREHVELN